MVRVAYKITKADGSIEENEKIFENKQIAKHFIVAGSGFLGMKKQIKKAKAALIYFEDYFPDNQFATGFNPPKGMLYDPTAKAQFSNLVGKAFADIFFKEEFKGALTYNYEAMVLNKKGKLSEGRRPDLYGKHKKEYYTIEAKGYTKTTSQRDLIKEQANAGKDELYRKYGIASVTEKIYSNIHVDFYDPEIDSQGEKYLENEFLKEYYSGIFEDYIKNKKYQRIIERKRIRYIIFETFKFKGEMLALGMLESIADDLSEGEVPDLAELREVKIAENIFEKIKMVNDPYSHLDKNGKRNVVIEVLKLYKDILDEQKRSGHSVEAILDKLERSGHSVETDLKNNIEETMLYIDKVRSILKEAIVNIHMEPFSEDYYKEILSNIEKYSKNRIEMYYKPTNMRGLDDGKRERFEIQEVLDYYLDYDGIGIFELLPDEVSYRINDIAFSNRTFKLVRNIY